MKIFLTLICLVLCNVTYSQSQKPNIVIILMDDMGYADTEPYGMTGIPTPNFNKLAVQGTRFTHFNAGQPVCTASRAALLTGVYPNRIGMQGALLPGAKVALNPKEETLATLLKGQGYTTAMLGKWHLGNKPPYTPVHYGFDSFYGIPYSHDIWPITWDSIRVTNPNDIRYDWPAVPVYKNDKVVETIITHKRASKLTGELTSMAVDFINKKKINLSFYTWHTQCRTRPLYHQISLKGKATWGYLVMLLWS